jgi:CheY-like chemotaxis protein
MSNGRILLVDDDPVGLQLMVSFLKSTSYQITTATDGLQAEEIIFNHAPNYFSAIVLDYQMPGRDGLSLLRQLKQDPRRLAPVIMQTAAKKPEQIQEGIDAGAFYYLIKPYKPNVFLSIIESAIKDFNNHFQVVRKLDSFEHALQLLRHACFEYRTLEEATHLSAFIAFATKQPKKIGIGLYELMVNAVEHGNLAISYDEKTELINQQNLKSEIQRRLADPNYRDRFVTVEIKQESGRLVISISDMGEGFEFEKYLEFSVERALDNHGRGIMMANKMSFDHLQYSNGGRTVTVCHQLNSPQS